MRTCCRKHGPRNDTYTPRRIKNWPFLSHFLANCCKVLPASLPVQCQRDHTHSVPIACISINTGAEETQGPSSCSLPGRRYSVSIRRWTPTTTKHVWLLSTQTTEATLPVRNLSQTTYIIADLLNPGPPGSPGRAGAAWPAASAEVAFNFWAGPRSWSWPISPAFPGHKESGSTPNKARDWYT